VQKTLIVGAPRRGIRSVLFLYIVSMVLSSSIAIIADNEHLTWCGFSLGEPIHLGNFEFIADYFSGLSLSPRRGNERAVLMGSTHSGHIPRSGPRSRTLPKSSSWHRAGREA
jgi:hypothetical protein